SDARSPRAPSGQPGTPRPSRRAPTAAGAGNCRTGSRQASGLMITLPTSGRTANGRDQSQNVLHLEITRGFVWRPIESELVDRLLLAWTPRARTPSWTWCGASGSRRGRAESLEAGAMAARTYAGCSTSAGDKMSAAQSEVTLAWLRAAL